MQRGMLATYALSITGLENLVTPLNTVCSHPLGPVRDHGSVLAGSNGGLHVALGSFRSCKKTKWCSYSFFQNGGLHVALGSFRSANNT